MAQFLGSVQGQRGEATRLGSKSSGMQVKCNGWNGGAMIDAGHTTADYFAIYATSGSNGRAAKFYIGNVDDAGQFRPSQELTTQVLDNTDVRPSRVAKLEAALRFVRELCGNEGMIPRERLTKINDYLAEVTP